MLTVLSVSELYPKELRTVHHSLSRQQTNKWQCYLEKMRSGQWGGRQEVHNGRRWLSPGGDTTTLPYQLQQVSCSFKGQSRWMFAWLIKTNKRTNKKLSSSEAFSEGIILLPYSKPSITLPTRWGETHASIQCVLLPVCRFKLKFNLEGLQL